MKDINDGILGEDKVVYRFGIDGCITHASVNGGAFQLVPPPQKNRTKKTNITQKKKKRKKKKK